MARTVLLVDDHRGFRRMASLLLQRAGHVVVGESGTASGAVESARALQPDLVLLDVRLPDGDGVEVAALLAALPHPPSVVLTSSHHESELGPRLTQAPVLGFVRKDELTVDRLAELFG